MKAVVGHLLQLERASHLESKTAANNQEGNVFQRVIAALAQFVGPDDERVVEQAAVTTGFGVPASFSVRWSSSPQNHLLILTSLAWAASSLSGSCERPW